MTILSDKTLYKYRKTLFPNQELKKDQFQPCSIDLTLDKELKTLHGDPINIEYGALELQPDEFILGSTREYVHVLENLVARVEGRSSIGRLGILVHVTAGFIDPGFKGNITLEIKNVSDQPFKLVYGDRLCQIVFEELDRECGSPYNGRYYMDTGAVCSRWRG